MVVRIDDLNALDSQSAERELRRCCGSTRWARLMVAARPFASVDAAGAAADSIWASLDRSDWLEAFAAHPRIGAPGGTKRAGAAEPGTAGDWAAQEQAGAAHAAGAVQRRLADDNRAYEERFGYIFIVCATGKSADEMLDILEQRMNNATDDELLVAAEEQRRITRLRLLKLLS
jgi:OHCU decarboxylase